MSSPAPQRRGATGVYTQVWEGYSLAERDRRWNAVRAKAVEAGFDCIFTPVGDGVNARYLTQFRASSAVLPANGSEPIVVTDRGSSNAWLPEPRLTAREWSEPMAEALRDAGMERGRIGVSGLRGGRFAHVSTPEGVVCHSAFAEVCRRLPQARFEDATDVLGAVRYVKSGEEIESIRKAARIASAGMQEFVRQAAAGLDATTIRARVLGLMLRLGSEYYPLNLTSDGGSLTAEINAVWGTQMVQMVQTTPSADGQFQEVFDSVTQSMRPGLSFGDLIGAYPSVVLRGIGAGDDGPLVTSASDTSAKAMLFEPNTAFMVRLSVDGETYAQPVLIGSEAVMPLP